MRALYFCVLSLTLLSGNIAHAAAAPTPTPAGVQMLPPVNVGTTIPCTPDPLVPGKSKVLSWDGQTPIACNTDFSIDQDNHNVQLPKASTTTDCNAEHTGSMRWNNSINSFEGCDGIQWHTFGGSSEWVALPTPGYMSDGYGLVNMGSDPSAPGVTVQIYGPNYQTVYTPNSWCQQKGYNAASGACINNANPQGMLTVINGSAGSLSSYGYSWFCSAAVTGNPQGAAGLIASSGYPTQILCVK